MDRHRFANARPTYHGRLGHPEAEGNRMFKLAGVIFTDRSTNIRWCLRVYLPTEKTPELVVWTRALWKQAPNHTGFDAQEVVDADTVWPDVQQFAWAELVRLRLIGRVRA